MKEYYQPPLLRSILLGILAFLAALAFFGYLGEITKWVGEIMYFLPGQLGLVDRVTPGTAIAVPVDRQDTEVTFPTFGQYQLYTNDIDLLTIADTLAQADKEGWLVVHAPDGQTLPITTIHRGLAVYDTPFAKGRPIYTFYIPDGGAYILSHPARPNVVIYFVPDVTTGNESAFRLVLGTEISLILIIAVVAVYRRDRHRNRSLRERRAEQRERAEDMYRRARKSRNDKDKKDRWSDQ